MLLPSFYTRSEVWFKRKRWLLGASAPSSYLVVDTAHSPCTPNSHNRESSGILCWQSTVNWASRKDGSIQLHVFLLLVACCCLIGFHLQKTNSMIKLRISEWQQQITKPTQGPVCHRPTKPALRERRGSWRSGKKSDHAIHDLWGL